jgi:hypothetical protein
VPNKRIRRVLERRFMASPVGKVERNRLFINYGGFFAKVAISGQR